MACRKRPRDTLVSTRHEGVADRAGRLNKQTMSSRDDEGYTRTETTRPVRLARFGEMTTRRGRRLCALAEPLSSIQARWRFVTAGRRDKLNLRDHESSRARQHYVRGAVRERTIQEGGRSCRSRSSMVSAIVAVMRRRSRRGGSSLRDFACPRRLGYSPRFDVYGREGAVPRRLRWDHQQIVRAGARLLFKAGHASAELALFPVMVGERPRRGLLAFAPLFH